MYKFSCSGKAIARGDDMKRPNKILEKKYITSLVIAAFLILSVLTAYNIRFGDHERGQAETEVEETIGRSGDAVRAGEDTGKEDAAYPEDEGQREPAAGENDVNGGSGQDDNGGTGLAGETDGSDEKEEQQETEEGQRADKENETEEERETDEEKEDGEGQRADREDASAWRESFDYDGSEEMLWPVMGNVILPYSMDTTVYYTTLDQYACNDGMLIGAKKGQEVVAAADGRIVNMYDSDRYGTVVTVRIGKKYELTYGQVEHVRGSVGDTVEKGEVLATVAEPTRTFTLEGPHLFFKMTLDGESVNPAEYLEK